MVIGNLYILTVLACVTLIPALCMSLNGVTKKWIFQLRKKPKKSERPTCFSCLKLVVIWPRFCIFGQFFLFWLINIINWPFSYELSSSALFLTSLISPLMINILLLLQIKESWSLKLRKLHMVEIPKIPMQSSLKLKKTLWRRQTPLVYIQSFAKLFDILQCPHANSFWAFFGYSSHVFGFFE